MAGESTFKKVGITDTLHHRMEIPEDYHGKDIIIGDWLGEIYHTPTDQYYTQSTRSQYYFPDVKPEGGFEISADITLSNYKKMRIQRSEDRNKFQ